ncbi:MAG TPA: tetratricopeptide repeat protein [Candidatus Scalindua sp.]|nr:tetratricopeptide repeat protein [Candidatus Scalindua sp.]
MQLLDSFKRLFVRIRFLAIVGGVLLWMATSQVVEIVKWSLPSWETILRNPSASYDQRMMFQWGTDSWFMAFVRNNTPSDACLITPPWVVPWVNQGNFLLSAYFLYPRKIYYGKGEVKREVETNKAITHVLVAWGRGIPTDRAVFGWPKFPVIAREFVHLPTEREVFLADLSVGPFSSDMSAETGGRNLILSLPLLENYLSDSQKKINEHRILDFDSPLEYFNLTYTRNNYDYWTKAISVPLRDKVLVEARVKANIRHSVNVITEVRYANDRLAVFGSLPNRTHNSWETLAINDLYQKAKRYGLVKGWPSQGMEITRIGINPGLPLEMPYLERYGVIELERGQERETELETRVDCAPTFLAQGHFHRAKNEIEEAIASYQLAEILNPEDAWVHFYLGEMYWRQGKPIRTIEEYQKAIELEPGIAWFHLALSEVYEEENEADLALEEFEKL